MKNNKRISKALDYIEHGSKLADIGCDHGYVLIQGIIDGIIESGIGVEVNEGPYKQALANIREHKLEDRLEIRLGNGLKPLKIGESDTAVIGGMGGVLIAEILAVDFEKARSFKRLILQPMGGEIQLRTFLLENGWRIIEEDILELDRLYLYIVAEKGEMHIDDPFLMEIGPLLAVRRSKVRDKYVKEQIEKLEYILKEMKKGREIDKIRLNELEKKLLKWRSYLEA